MANIHPSPELYSKRPDIDDAFLVSTTAEPYLDEADDAAAENPTRYTGEEVFSRARRRIHGEKNGCAAASTAAAIGRK